jgi:hypothetical protein
MWDAVIRFLRFLDKMSGMGWAMLVWEVRAIVLVVAAVLVWLFLPDSSKNHQSG